MIASGNGRIGDAGSYPKIDIGIVSAAAVEKEITPPTPDDHVASGPDCRVRQSGIRRVASAGGCPTVSNGIVFAATVIDSG